jgi:hypothetical protein
MQVARAFGRKGFGVEQARTYVDVNSDALREVDVRASSRSATSLYLRDRRRADPRRHRLPIGALPSPQQTP